MGVFLGCFENEGKCFCIVRYMEPVMIGTALRLNQFDCPLFTLMNILRVLPSVNISCSISVVHQCSTTCVLKEKAVETTLEGHRVTHFCRMIGPITCIATMCFVCQKICELCLQLDFSNNSTDMNNKNHDHKKKVSYSKTYVVLISFRHCSRDD